jgi:hypothetical protein
VGRRIKEVQERLQDRIGESLKMWWRDQLQDSLVVCMAMTGKRLETKGCQVDGTMRTNGMGWKCWAMDAK